MARDDTAARALFKRLQTADAWREIVERWKEERARETNHLEFKGKKDRNVARLAPEDEKNIGKAISALANTGGGLLVLGVDARGHDVANGEFDRVRELLPIQEVEVCEALVKNKIGGITDPAVVGLETWPVKQPDTTAGIVAVYVPGAEGAPHQYNDRFYMRSVAGSAPAPFTYIAAMFGRTPPCRLELVARFESFAASALPMVELRLRNRGRGTARRPAIRLEGCPLEWSAYVGDERFFRRPVRLESGVEAILFEPREPTLVVYPEDEVVVMRGRVAKDAYSSLGGTNVPFAATLYALDAQPRRGTGTLSMGPFEDQDAALKRRVVLPREDE